MNNQLDKKSIMQMGMGAILERVDYAMSDVINNILDPNTKPTAKRKIQVTLELTPDDERQVVRVQAVAKSTLVPTNPISTSLYLDRRNGEAVVMEMTPQIPGQIDMYGAIQEEPATIRLLKQG